MNRCRSEARRSAPERGKNKNAPLIKHHAICLGLIKTALYAEQWMPQKTVHFRHTSAHLRVQLAKIRFSSGSLDVDFFPRALRFRFRWIDEMRSD